jgi:hypothetical protein
MALGKSHSSSKAQLQVFDVISALENEEIESSRDQHQSTRNHRKHRVHSQQLAVTSQSRMYGKLLECRILLQQAITAAKDNTIEMKHNDLGDSGDSDNDDKNQQKLEAKSAMKYCDDLLHQLLQIRHQLVPNLPCDDVDKPIDSLSVAEGHDSDLGASNDTKEMTELDDHYSSLMSSRKRSAPQLESTLAMQYNHCRDLWRDTLTRRHKELRLFSGQADSGKSKFRVLDNDFWDQVQATTQYESLRSSSNAVRYIPQPEQTNSSQTSLTCSNIMVQFDDSKVYQQILKDFITSTAIPASNTKLNAPGSNEFATRIRNHGQASSKALVDQKASKGRKIRYHEIPKLRNFTFPLRRESKRDNFNTLDEDSYFQSLFGCNLNKRANVCDEDLLPI